MKGPKQEARRSRFWSLLAINVVLLVGLAAVTFTPSADAQFRVRGHYLMAAGDANGSLSSVIYIVDTTNQEMIAVNYEPSRKKLEGIGYRNLAADTAALMQGGLSR